MKTKTMGPLSVVMALALCAAAPGRAQEPAPCPQNVGIELSVHYPQLGIPLHWYAYTYAYVPTAVIRAVYTYGPDVDGYSGYQRVEVPGECRSSLGPAWSWDGPTPPFAQVGYDPWFIQWAPTPNVVHWIKACVRNQNGTPNPLLCATTRVYVAP